MERLPPSFARNILYAQITFYIFIAICLIIAPRGLSENNGLSYFGTHRQTAGWFAVAIVGAIYFMWLALRDFSDRQKHLEPFKRVLEIVMIAMLGIVLTPYSLSGWIHAVHNGFSSILFATQLLLGLWIILRIKNTYLNWLVWLAQLAAGIMSLIYLASPQGFLTQGQLLFQLSFSVLLLRNLRYLEPRL